MAKPHMTNHQVDSTHYSMGTTLQSEQVVPSCIQIPSHLVKEDDQISFFQTIDFQF